MKASVEFDGCWMGHIPSVQLRGSSPKSWIKIPNLAPQKQKNTHTQEPRKAMVHTRVQVSPWSSSCMVVYAHMQGSSGFRLWNLKLVGCHRSGFDGFKAHGLENSAKSQVE